MIPETKLEARKLPRQRRSQEMVDTLLEATARVLSQEGYAAATTNRIAKVAGISVGSLYQYFPNKDALVLAVHRRHVEDMHELLAGAAALLGQADEQTIVRSFVHGMIAAHQDEPELHQALVQQMLALGLEEFKAAQTQTRLLVRTWLGVVSERIAPRDLDHAAFLLVATVESVVHAAVFEDPARLHDPAFEDELVALVVRYLGVGTLSPPATTPPGSRPLA